MSDTEKLSFCRIAWNINSAQGHGDWFDNTQENVSMLKSYVEPLNEQYGSGSHRLEFIDGDESREVADHAIMKAMMDSKRNPVM